jgi:chorismate dehydratase
MGLEQYHGWDFDMHLLVPSMCAEVFKKGLVDLALVPVGALLDIEDYHIVSDFCIGSEGEVRTVCIFSHTPINACHTLYLDEDSRTSALLSKLILHQYMQLDIHFIQSKVDQVKLKPGEAVLMIGDKVFDHEGHYAYKIDLGHAWSEWQCLPFAYAVWVARKDVSSDVVNHLQKALSLGMTFLPSIIDANPVLSTYYSKHISYFLSDKKRESIRLFLEKIREIAPSRDSKASAVNH